MVPLVHQVMKQTRARIFRGDTSSEGKIVSVFEPSTEIIRKGKTSKPTEFGKMVKLQRPKIRSSPPMKSTVGGPPIATC
jgi:IS5 family transposase